MKAFYIDKPGAVYALPNGDIAVCIDFEPTTILTPSGEVSGYSCRRIDIDRASITAEAVIELMVRDRYTQSQEFALINAYQASVAGIAKDEDKEAEYLDFLRWRQQMKDAVKEIVPAYCLAHPVDVEPISD